MIKIYQNILLVGEAEYLFPYSRLKLPALLTQLNSDEVFFHLMEFNI